TQRYIVASLAKISQPRPSTAGISTSRFARYRARVSSTWRSSFQATTEARCTNSCGAVPTVGRYDFRAATTSGGAATKPERYPVIEDRLLSVWKTTVRDRSAAWSAEGGGSSNHSSVYASSEPMTKS